MNISPEIVTTPEQLKRLATRLEKELVLAFDLEADSMHHYTEKVCLIQVSGRVETVLIDPLAFGDLSLLAPLLASPAILKVMHGADYDIRSLHRDFGIEIVNLFDTMIAAQFLGEPEIGLAALLRKRFGVELDKKYQKADWSKRPLDTGMIEYAARDTVHLIELYQQMAAELRALGRYEWVEEECRLLCGVRSAEREDGPLFLRFKGAAGLSPRALAVLEEVLRFRDSEARKSDIPSFKILGTDTVRSIAERLPTDMDHLKDIPGLSPRLVQRYGRGILDAVDNGLAKREEDLPQLPRRERVKRDAREEKRLKILKEWREKKAAALGIAPGIVANNALLEKVAALFPQDQQALCKIGGLKKWHCSELAAGMVEALRGS